MRLQVKGTWLGGGVQILLQEGHGVDLFGVSRWIQKLHSGKVARAAAQLV